MAGGEKSGRRADIPAAMSGTIPAAAGAVVEDGGREVDPGTRAELLRGFSGAVAWPGYWTTARRSKAGGARDYSGGCGKRRWGAGVAVCI